MYEVYCDLHVAMLSACMLSIVLGTISIPVLCLPVLKNGDVPLGVFTLLSLICIYIPKCNIFAHYRRYIIHNYFTNSFLLVVDL